MYSITVGKYTMPHAVIHNPVALFSDLAVQVRASVLSNDCQTRQPKRYSMSYPSLEHRDYITILKYTVTSLSVLKPSVCKTAWYLFIQLYAFLMIVPDQNSKHQVHFQWQLL